VKPNVGHSEGASGITSLIKAVLALEHKTIPPNIKFITPNPKSRYRTALNSEPTDTASPIRRKTPRGSSQSNAMASGPCRANKCQFIWNWRVKRTRRFMLLGQAVVSDKTISIPTDKQCRLFWSLLLSWEVNTLAPRPHHSRAISTSLSSLQTLETRCANL